MGLFSKKKKKDRTYRSEEAKDDPDPDFKKKKDPYLIIGDAPPKPFFAGAGLSSNTTYQVQRGRSGDQGEEKPGVPGPVKPVIPDRPGKVVHVLKLLQAACVVYVVFLALFIKWLKPQPLTLFSSILLGIALGIGYSFLHQYYRTRQNQLSELLNLVPGRKGLRTALGEVPSWVAFQDKEKVEWLNRMLQGMWPYYDKAIGAAIKEAVEPMMEQYKPPGLIKKIYFAKLTFGDAPMRIDNVWVEDEGDQHVLLEVAFRWAGDANIAIAIELPAGGEQTRLVPKVTDLQVAGVARVILSPLVPVIPGFGAAVIALRKPPLIRFKLDFGKAFGGSLVAKPIRLWLDPFIRETLSNMIVWPNRIVVPMLPEEATGSLDHLYLRHVGLLVVHVAQARDLKKVDTIGKSDPFVELHTQPNAVAKTEVQKRTLTPKWEEDKWLLVQEPKTQIMRVQVFDHDVVNLKELISINVVKGIKDTVGARTFLGRAAIPVRPFADRPGETVQDWYDLGKGEWSNEDGTGKGEGQLELKVTYFPFELLYSKPRDASLGAVLVTLKKVSNLPAADGNGTSDPYVRFELDDHKRTSSVQQKTLNGSWNEKFEWLYVPVVEVLEATVWDNDPLSNDNCLGVVEIDIAQDVAKVPGGRIYKTWYLEDVPKDVKTKKVPSANITMQVQWVPFDFSM
ncbi:hypothetical protein COCSUDRAFT_46488 [Coccomyxa subellipsoidea C-169]|uniref:C2 domain-containing protein n=1 Tax=Coccomyxa subellipsoidea (strain C-169) TaxID=574566 RepID=I0Z624_COCSC|nr:hypothetical protein COCSUDRAFT_46488 [Coccomyxa subellipsoidea C-169]EIE26093.1 hypothetical protein COCSUDRAFT_46488 [Coccomyxa subellipsoidea C-169]|eukprot:XP_005650637.1 hypothetical protein COCSUDRAFT_46488 [Coccomyxa subellipsoidea C-169]